MVKKSKTQKNSKFQKNTKSSPSKTLEKTQTLSTIDQTTKKCKICRNQIPIEKNYLKNLAE